MTKKPRLNLQRKKQIKTHERLKYEHSDRTKQCWGGGEGEGVGGVEERDNILTLIYDDFSLACPKNSRKRSLMKEEMRKQSASTVTELVVS